MTSEYLRVENCIENLRVPGSQEQFFNFINNEYFLCLEIYTVDVFPLSKYVRHIFSRLF